MSLYDLIAPFYDVDMALNMPFDDVGFWADACAARGKHVLELGCGNGRITRGLLAAGLAVCAVDRSAPMLAGLRRALGHPGELQVIRADLRTLPLRARFDLVLAPYSLCTYWLDDHDWQAALDGIRERLQPGGWLLIDAFAPRPLPPDTGFQEDYQRPWQGGWLRRERRLIPLEDGINRIERRYSLLDHDGRLLQQIDTNEHLRPVYPEQLESRLQAAGFTLEDRVWDYADPRAQDPPRFFTCLARWQGDRADDAPPRCIRAEATAGP